MSASTKWKTDVTPYSGGYTLVLSTLESHAEPDKTTLLAVWAGEVLKTVICLLPVILVWKIMGKYLKAVTNVKPVIFSSNTQISKTCYSLLKTCYSLS